MQDLDGEVIPCERSRHRGGKGMNRRDVAIVLSLLGSIGNICMFSFYLPRYLSGSVPGTWLWYVVGVGLSVLVTLGAIIALKTGRNKIGGLLMLAPSILVWAGPYLFGGILFLVCVHSMGPFILSLIGGIILLLTRGIKHEK